MSLYFFDNLKFVVGYLNTQYLCWKKKKKQKLLLISWVTMFFSKYVLFFYVTRACLVTLFEQQFSLFKQHNMYFRNTFFTYTYFYNT